MNKSLTRLLCLALCAVLLCGLMPAATVSAAELPETEATAAPLETTEETLAEPKPEETSPASETKEPEEEPEAEETEETENVETIVEDVLSADAADAAATYDVNAALAYAKAHWNDGQGLCAEFVSRCVIAGGLNISVKTGTGGCWKAICAATGLSMQPLKLNSSGYATKALDGSILAAGDVVVQWCNTHSISPHIMICGGYDSSGYATYYAHNGAMNNARYKLSVNLAYEHTTDCDMGGQVIRLSTLGAGTITASWSDYAAKPVSIGNTDATLSRTLSVTGTSISNVSKVGITLYNGTGSTVLTSKTETPVSKDGVINMYYYVNSELGYTLTKNTQYKYRFQAVIAGKTYYSPTYTFVTGPNQGYTVTFNANGGSCSQTSKKVPNGALYGTLPTPTRTNYTFDGWYTAASGGSRITADTQASLSANITLYAHWTHVCAAGHSYKGVVTPPTCAQQGYTTYTCSVCGDSYKGDYVAATGKHTYSSNTDTTCDVCGYTRTIDTGAKIETVPMYRLYNPNTGEHFYTGSTKERDDLKAAGWRYEGVAWNAPVSIGEPVYRMCNPNSGDHHYTMSWTEVTNLKKEGWNYEGVAWNSAPKSNPNSVGLYRLYNPNADLGSHHYTSSEVEKNNLVSQGWRLEGIGWYGLTK